MRMRRRQAIELLVEGGTETIWDDLKWESCLSKRRYPSLAAALKALRHLPSGFNGLHPYVCPYAGDGHLHMASGR